MPRPVTSTDLFLEQVVDRLDRVITLLEEQAPSDGAERQATRSSGEPAGEVPEPSSKSTTSSTSGSKPASRSRGKGRRS